MRLGKKWALQSAVFAVFATVVLLLMVNIHLRRHGVLAAEEKARLILHERQATIDYVTKDLRPGLFKLIKEHGVPSSYFDPSWMSAAYINRHMMKYFNNSEFSEYYYKNATVNARSPENEANQYEKEYLEKVRANPELEPLSEIIEIEGKPFYIFIQRHSGVFSAGCMRCHSTPEKAPGSLVDLYGPERSFNKNIGVISSVLSLRIPLAEVYASINTLTITLFMAIGTILAAIFFIQWFIVKRSIISPIKKLTNKSTAITEDESLLGDEITLTGQGELAEMARAFSEMSQKLAASKENLETLVAERTGQLRESRDQAQAYLNIAGVMFAVLDRSGKITMINRKGCEILGISEQEAIGLNWFDNFLPQSMVKDVSKVFEQLMQGEIDAVEYYENPVLTKSGEERLVAFHNSLLKGDSGEITGVLWSGEDVTERHLAAEEKLKLESQLRQSHKMEAIGTMAGGIAHDFNNILAAILGYADMANDDTPGHSPAKYQIEQVLKAGNRAKDLVKQILAFSRKETRERVPVKCHLIITEALKLLRASIPTTIEISQNIDSSSGNILAEPTQIHQVLMNICTNAAQAMDEKGGVLQIALTNVELNAGDLVNNPTLKPGPYVRLSVKDNGAGIDKMYLDRIFDPYFTTKEVGQGSGMGLAVVTGIVKSHDGLITVESKPGEGTLFNVYFPVIGEQVQEEIIDAEPLQNGNEKILVVDDEGSMVDMTKRRIERLGYQVTTKTDSGEALELFRSKPGHFDLVITDQTMPGLTGDQLAKELMAISPDIPIILCTGYSSKIDASRAKDAGIRAFIMKPVDIKELSATIRQALDEKDLTG